MGLKVCHIIPTLDQGGAEKQLCLLATQLDRNEFETHVVVLTHSGPREAELTEHGVPVHAINKRGKLDPLAYGRLVKMLRDLAPDVVHTWLFAANCYGRSAAKRARVRTIIGGERCVDPWKSWWHFALDRHYLRYSQAVITNTSAVVDFYRQRKFDVSKFEVIPNGVQPPTVAKLSRQEVFERLKIPPRSKLVMCVGRLWPQKGYRDIIWAGELLRVAYRDVALVIVGDGPERESLQYYRDQTKANGAVYFAGHRTDAMELLSGADLLWNGSLYEGQSNTILEAMSMGIPVIASDIPGNRDLVVNGETGFLFSLGDVAALTRFSNRIFLDSSLGEQLGAAGRERAKSSFSVSQMLEKHANLYRKWGAR